MKIVVLGGGVVGVTSANYLGQDGHEVTLIERNDEVASETSFANAGLIAPGDSYAWASPEALKLFLQSLYRRDLGIRLHWRLDPELWAWSFQFLLQCTRARTRINTLRKLRLTLYARACLNALIASTGIAYDGEAAGIAYFYRSQQSLDHGAAHMRLMAEHGLEIALVDRDELVRREPALSAVKEKLAGGIIAPMDQTGDACRFARNLARWSVEHQGLRLATATNIMGFEMEGRRLARVRTDKGAIAADAFVLAMGCDSARFARRIGVDLPIYPVKGYSVSLPIGAGEVAPRMGGVDEDRLIGYSRLGDRLRVASSAEFAGHDRNHVPADFTRLLAGAAELFPGCGDPGQATYWAGLRPLTPSSVPILGRARFENLYLNVGHGHLGWTMCCGTAKLIGDLIAGRRPEVDPDGFLYEG